VLHVDRSETTKGLFDMVDDEHRIFLLAAWDRITDVKVGCLLWLLVI